jgi:hypothetical protein
MPEMVTSYVRYCTEQATAGGPLCTSPDEEEMRVQEVYEIRVVDMFGMSFFWKELQLLMVFSRNVHR